MTVFTRTTLHNILWRIWEIISFSWRWCNFLKFRRSLIKVKFDKWYLFCYHLMTSPSSFFCLKDFSLSTHWSSLTSGSTHSYKENKLMSSCANQVSQVFSMWAETIKAQGRTKNRFRFKCFVFQMNIYQYMYIIILYFYYNIFILYWERNAMLIVC